MSEFMDAVRMGDVRRVNELIASGANPYERDGGTTALEAAVFEGQGDVVNALLAADARVDGKILDQALALAVLQGHLDFVIALIAAGADVKSNGMDLLHKATLRGYLDCVKALIAAGADVNAKSSKRPILVRTVEKGHVGILKALIAAGANVNARDDVFGTTALHTAVKEHQLECVRAIIDAGADVSVQDRMHKTALTIAVEDGDAESVRLLVAAGADVNARDTNGRTLLQEAHPSMKAILRKAGAKRTIDWPWAAPALGAVLSAFAIGPFFHWLVKSAPIWMVGLFSVVAASCLVICVISFFEGRYGLVDFIDGQDRRFRTLCVWAALVLPAAVAVHLYAPSAPIWAAGLAGILTAPILCSLTFLRPEQLPLRPGGPPQISERFPASSFRLAVERHDLKTAEAALKQFPHLVSEKNSNGGTLLHDAAESGQTDAVGLLLACGANIDAKDTLRGSTPLHLAIRKRRRAVAELLLAKGADINAANEEGYTPLHEEADVYPDVEMVELLLANGADVNAVDKYGKTPLQLARQLNRWEMVGLLRSQSAKLSGASIPGPEVSPEALSVIEAVAASSPATAQEKGEPCPECGFPLTANMRERDVIVTFDSAAACFACPECDTRLRAPLHQITKNRGVNVKCSCRRITHIPPSVWCSTCGNSLASGWQSTLSIGPV